MATLPLARPSILLKNGVKENTIKAAIIFYLVTAKILLMDKWDKLALLFGILTVGVLGETFDISNNDGSEHRTAVLRLGTAISAVCLFFAFKFFLKKKQ